MSGPRAVGVREAGAADVAAVADLEARVFGAEAWSRALVEELRRADLARGVLLVAPAAEHEAALLGYAVVTAVGGDAELHRIAVAPHARRRGVADRLLEAGSDRVRAAGATRLLLEVRADNAPALALYARSGFAEIGRRARYYRDGTAAVILERPLASPTHDVTMEA